MTDLDPDLLKIVTAAPASDASSAQATNAPVEKVCIKVQFVNLKKTDDPATLRIIARLEEAVKVYLMEVGGTSSCCAATTDLPLE